MTIQDTFPIDQFIENVYHHIKEFGYFPIRTSKKENSTAEQLKKKWLDGTLKKYKNPKNGKFLIDQTNKTIPTNIFKIKIKEKLKQPYMSFKDIPFLTSIIYNLDRQTCLQPTEYKYDFYGTKGEKINIEYKILKEYERSFKFGTMKIHEFIDNDNHLFIWLDFNKLTIPSKGRFYASIRKHKKFENNNQTIIAFPKFDNIFYIDKNGVQYKPIRKPFFIGDFKLYYVKSKCWHIVKNNKLIHETTNELKAKNLIKEFIKQGNTK